MLAGTGANRAKQDSDRPAHRQQQTQCRFAVLPTPHTGKRAGARPAHWQRERQCCLLRCLSRCLAGKPDSTQLVYWQRKSQYGFTVLIQLTPHLKTERCPVRAPAARTSARFSVLLQPTTAAKPDSAQLMPSAASGISTAILCHFSPGAWPVFSLPGIAIHQQFVIYGIFYTELRFSRAGYWSIWA